MQRNHHKAMSHWKLRARAALIHLGVSLAVAALAAAVVFGVWYPYPYRDLSGGRELFVLLVSVDVILGPLITLVVFDRRKPRRELVRDMLLVALIQLSALGYGLWTVSVARPVWLVFEYNRFRVVHAIDVPPELLHQAPVDLQSLPWSGPQLLSLRPFKSQDEYFDATMAALKGFALAAQPGLWQSYEQGRPGVLEVARPLSALQARFESHAADMAQRARQAGRQENQVVWVPMLGRKTFWTVLLDAQSGQVLDFMALDSF